VTLLQTRAVTRRFPGVVALHEVDFSAGAGEVHAVCGANGAGKSTLMNVLSGTIQPGSGQILIDDEPVQFSSPADARDAGIAIVYQELSSIPELTVADNIFLGREFRGRLGLLDRKRASNEAAKLLKRHGIALEPDAVVAGLGVADRQLVELARALSTEARILILDEPTAVLSRNEQEKLFGVIRTLRERGLLVLYISHRLEEVFAIADRVSVMRDGKLVATRNIREIGQAELVLLMTGHTISARKPPPRLAAETPAVLTLRGLARDGADIALCKGEILGLAGLVGAGRTSIARRLAGLLPREGFTALIDGRPLPQTVAGVLSSGIVYLTEDRRSDGVFAPLAIPANATAAALEHYVSAGLLALGRERREASGLLQRLRLVARSLDVPVATLSGGNQQKVLFARALLAKPKVLICDEPTRGVDVAAREDIYDLLRDMAAQGVAIILISSELNEVLELSHRIAIVRHGAVQEIMENHGLSEHALVTAATGTA
jgi:ABC-type sugar transport system ATPase subunit